MDQFHFLNGQLFCEATPVAKIAEECGTPAYVYSRAAFLQKYREFANAFGELHPTICFSVKCCGNLSILRLLAAAGCGFDVTSGGELQRALRAGGEPGKIIYAGVGKTDPEIVDAINAGIAAFNCESEEEIENVDRIAAAMGRTIIGAVRVNPDVDARSHAKTTTGKKQTKFGVDIDRVEDVFDHFRSLRHLRLAGVHIHIGSPVLGAQPYVDAVSKATGLIDRLTAKGHEIRWLDCGGGFPAAYEALDDGPGIHEFARVLVPLLRNKPYKIAFEPGRYIAANSGILLTRVLYRKSSGDRRFVIVDAGMNDLLRPTLYEAYHHIWPTSLRGELDLPGARRRGAAPPDAEKVNIVGPVCETGDYLALDRPLPPTRRGDLLAVFSAGAYGFAMASNYNNRPRPAEVLVDGTNFQVIRRRETLEQLLAGEDAA